MDTKSAITTIDNSNQVVIQIVLDSLSSINSKRAYAKALHDFFDWHKANGSPRINKTVVQRYKTKLQESGLAPSTINLRMSALRKLAQEAADNGIVDQAIANGVSKIKGVKSAGVRLGNWLTKDQAQDLITSPEITTLKGLRDRAILGVMIGAGLRRSEVSELNFNHIQQREGRWVIVDLVGKGNRVRTVPMPSWSKFAIDEWTQTANIETGNIFCSINKGDYISGDSITAQAVHDVVKHYSDILGIEIAPHDLRRTFAKLAHKGGSGLDQIQLSLGHASIKTTEKYLGVEQNLHDAPCDRLGLLFG